MAVVDGTDDDVTSFFKASSLPGASKPRLSACGTTKANSKMYSAESKKKAIAPIAFLRFGAHRRPELRHVQIGVSGRGSGHLESVARS